MSATTMLSLWPRSPALGSHESQQRADVAEPVKHLDIEHEPIHALRLTNWVNNGIDKHVISLTKMTAECPPCHEDATKH